MITHKGTLPIGIEYEGSKHREYEFRARKVRDSIEAEEENSGVSDSRMGLAIIAKQIVALGTIPREAITSDLLLDMYDEDLKEFQRADREVSARLTTFFEQRGRAKRENAGARAAETGDKLPRGD